MKKKLLGATIAATAALAFATVSATSAMAAEMHGVKCMGINACKGKAACATADNKCKGMNACKGKGYVMKNTDKACKKAGGTVEVEK